MVFFSGFFLCFSPVAESARNSQPFAQEAADLPPSCLQFAQSTDQGGELMQALKADGSAVSYARLGQFYLEGGEAGCALRAFQRAVSKDSSLWEAHYGLGLAFLQQGENPRAVEELRIVLQHAPQDSMAHNALGLGLEEMRDYASAEQEFKTALDLDPQFDVACFNLAHVLGAQKKYPGVIFYLKKAVALAPQQPAYRLALGTAYVANGDFDAAIQSLNDLLSIAPDSAEAYFLLGDAYLKRANPQMAAQSYRKALQLDPQNELARVRLAQALLTGGNDAEAVASLREHTLRQPDDFQGYYLLGHAYRDLNELGEAREALEQAVRINPDDYKARFELGLVLERLGLNEPASQQLQAAIRLNPEESQAHHELSKVLRGLKDGAGAQQEFQEFLKLEAKERDKKSAAALHAQAIAAMKQGDAARAIGAYREALRFDSSDPQLQYDFALALGEGGDRREQELHLQQTIKLDPNLAGAHSQLGLLYMNSGRTGDAKTEFGAALGIDPQDTEAQVGLGVLYAKEGKEEEAGRLFRQAIENNPKSAAGHANLGLLLASQGHESEAEQELKQAAQIAPDDPKVLPVLASLQSKLGRLVDSTCTLNNLAELQPLSAQAHVELGTALTALYFHQAALEEFSKGVRLDPNSALARLYTGRTLFDLGRIGEARQELQAACTLSPNVAGCWYLFALVERQAKNIPLSIKYLEDVVRLEPQNADAEFLLGQSWFELGNREKATEHWKAALQAFPDQWRSLYSLAQTLSSVRDPEAPKYHDRLQALESQHHVLDRVGLLSQLAREAAAARDWPAVVTRYQEALRECGRCSSAVELHRALGTTYCQIGRLASGEHELRTAVQLRPDDAHTLDILHRVTSAREDIHQKGWASLCSRPTRAAQKGQAASDASQ
jgi:tetratricopeptide (TPR) repeat protein